jgi:tetratricopeptide (TPR) repeat protein
MPGARIAGWAAAALVFSTTAALAAEPQNITPGELALTPAFCQDVQTMNGWTQYSRESPRAPFWIAQMGKTFWGMHHYCWALINIHRSRAPGQSSQERAFKIHSAIADYYYVIRIAPPDFVLLPEIYHLIGEAHVMVGEYVQAIDAYQKSRLSKADYWPPYEGHAKVMEKLGKKVEARAVLADGLALMPTEPTLLTMYKRLGGDPSKLPPPRVPVPVAAAPASAAAPAAPASAAQPQ